MCTLCILYRQLRSRIGLDAGHRDLLRTCFCSDSLAHPASYQARILKALLPYSPALTSLLPYLQAPFSSSLPCSNRHAILHPIPGHLAQRYLLCFPAPPASLPQLPLTLPTRLTTGHKRTRSSLLRAGRLFDMHRQLCLIPLLVHRSGGLVVGTWARSVGVIFGMTTAAVEAVTISLISKLSIIAAGQTMRCTSGRAVTQRQGSGGSQAGHLGDGDYGESVTVMWKYKTSRISCGM